MKIAIICLLGINFVFANGDTYEGSWKDGKRHGQGTYTSTYKGKYIGDWVNGKRHGQGIYIFKDGTWISGKFENNYILTDRSNLGDLKFLGLLTGMSSTGQVTYSSGIMADFLSNQKGAEEIAAGQALKQAEEILKDNPSVAAPRIKAALKNKQSQLLIYGFRRHTMGIQLTPMTENQEKFVDCDLYNSGAGLEYHIHVPEKGKYQTRLRIRVPLKELTEKKIQELLNYSQFPSAKEAYEAILNIHGARKIEATNEEAVLQNRQKSGNCSLEWIFAYLKHTLSNYKQMRVNLFKACKTAIEQATWEAPPGHPGTVTLTPEGTKGQWKSYNLTDAKQLLIQELDRKIVNLTKPRIF